MKLKIQDIKGNSQGELEVKFPLITNGKGTQAVHDTVVAYNAAQRSGTACTKNAGEVAGTNKKPWKQKGTGRARAGSFHSPLVARRRRGVRSQAARFQQESFPRAPSSLSLRKALSERLNAGDVLVVDDLKLASPKTKEFVGVLSALKLDGTALFVAHAADKNLTLASRNVAQVELTTSDALNTYQILRSDKLVFTSGAFEKVEERLSKE